VSTGSVVELYPRFSKGHRGEGNLVPLIIDEALSYLPYVVPSARVIEIHASIVYLSRATLSIEANLGTGHAASSC